MVTLFFFCIFLAIALPSLRIYRLGRIATIASLCAAALLFNVVYIQSIGSGTYIFSQLLYETIISIDSPQLLLLSLVPIKPQRLTKEEKEALSLSPELKQILVGLTLGDLNIRMLKKGKNPLLRFEQGLVHKEYLLHLYSLFEDYCLSVPKIINRLPDKRTGNVYTQIRFHTRSLPCFKELYSLFYLDGIKIVPSIIFDLLTPIGLCYWFCEDGSLCKTSGRLIICTDSFTLDEVTLLVSHHTSFTTCDA